MKEKLVENVYFGTNMALNIVRVIAILKTEVICLPFDIGRIYQELRYGLGRFKDHLPISGEKNKNFPLLQPISGRFK